jgi:8-hydroxy-5-deazaflavin:NADPH oxidoreductase
MKIGIIGAGNVGGELGKLWAGKGHEILFGVRDGGEPQLKDLLNSIQGKARAGTVKDAASFGEVVVLATPWPASEDAIKAARDLTGKVLVDCTNPLLPDLSGLTIGTTTSAGEKVAGWAKGARVVKAFNTIGAPNFGNPKFGSENASMFICGDDAGAKTVVTRLATDLGFDAVDAGPLTASRLLEPLGMLWIHLAFKQGLGPTGHAFKLLRR